MPDSRVLDSLAAELGVRLGLPTVEAARAELAELGRWDGLRAAAPDLAGRCTGESRFRGSGARDAGGCCSTPGRLQDGEPHLAGTARQPVARVSAATAAEVGVADGAGLTVATDRGSVTLAARDHRDARPRGLGAAELARLAGVRSISVPAPGTSSPSLPLRRTSARSNPPLEVSGDRAAHRRRPDGRTGPGFGDDPWWLVLLKAVGDLRPADALHAVQHRVRAQGRRPDAARVGPNRPGPWGTLQSLADGVKLILKETITPRGIDRVVYVLAPIIAAIPAFMVFAVIPMGPEVSIFGAAHTAAADRHAGRGAARARHRLGRRLRHRLGRLGQRLDLPAARRHAVVGAGDLLRDRDGAVLRRRVPVRGLDVDLADRRRRRSGCWFVVILLPSFVVYLVSMVGETNRAPFDLPEAEGELVAGS